MVFNSLAYLFFIGIVFVLFYISPVKYRWVWLLVASIVYYLSFIPVFLSVLVAVVLFNYFAGRLLFSTTHKKAIMILVVTFNILILASFKYFHTIFPDTVVHLYYVDWFFRIDPINHLIIPIGLSYITFTSLSYLIEINRKTFAPEKHLGYFTLYLVFFPKVAQGPIERPKSLIPQLHQLSTFNYPLAVEGLKQMLWGFFKKLVVADRLAIYVNTVYGNYEHHNGTTLLVATLFYAFQIYADFSGYTDIALGTAKLFGINLTDNFRRPYLATSIQDFWNRWHISFSTWLRDYLFLPLAYFFSKKMKKESYLFLKTEKWIYLFSIMITFAIAGWWHGEGANFLIWGLLFGVFLTYSNWTAQWSKSLRKRLKIRQKNRIYKAYKVLITFLLVTFIWIFFRSTNDGMALRIIESIIFDQGKLFIESPGIFLYSVFGIITLIALDIKREYFNQSFSILYNKSIIIRYLGYTTIILIILLIGVFDGGSFLYFQF